MKTGNRQSYLFPSLLIMPAGLFFPFPKYSEGTSRRGLHISQPLPEMVAQNLSGKDQHCRVRSPDCRASAKDYIHKAIRIQGCGREGQISQA